MDSTPVSLVLRLHRLDDTEAWRRFAELIVPLLDAWARRLGLQEAEAADLVQDVFAILLEQLPSFRYDPKRSFRGWLWTILSRTAGKRSRRPQPAFVPAETLERPSVVEPPDEAEFRRYLVGRALQVMTTDFNPETWKACWAVVAENRPAKEVARDLGMSVNAVYLARSRVLARLRRELEGMLD
ncbi:MAG TPA: sigma-70 family RNA polymerase sigma factor [Gemmataceae bacterium]|nr:sigma-70 family RNA polymerase sigma factor [Gemmataceae bacterium]